MGSLNPAPQLVALTRHPLQRCGAWATAVLGGRSAPDELTSTDLNAVITRLVADVVTSASASAQQNTAAYDWWKVLFALYPNSKATHNKRIKNPAELHAQIAQFFTPDAASDGAWCCTFCGQPTGTLWAKSQLPMFDTAAALNTLPPDLAGWPVCRGCRIALWALPYGAWVTAGSATVVMCRNPAIERRFVASNVKRAGRIQQLGFTGIPADASAEAVTLAALRAHTADAPADAVLWSFKNDNQDPWLQVTAARQATTRLLQRIESDAVIRRGWNGLRHALSRRDKQSRGYTAIARTLFDGEQRHTDRILRELRRELADPPAHHGYVDGCRSLARAYQEEMYGMDTTRLAPARDLIVAWILAGTSHRGRFNEYVKGANSAYPLARLLEHAAARIHLDGARPPDITAISPMLLTGGQDGWRWRAQLFFEVSAALSAADASIGRTPTEEDDVDLDQALRLAPDESLELEEEYA